MCLCFPNSDTRRKRLSNAIESNWSSDVQFNSGGSKLPLFCVPAFKATGLSFAKLAKHLGHEQPVIGLTPWGKARDRGSPRQVDEIAKDYVQRIRRIAPNGPYYLTGACVGASLALETAVQLQAQNQKVAMLALFGPASIPVPHFYPWSVFHKHLGSLFDHIYTLFYNITHRSFHYYAQRQQFAQYVMSALTGKAKITINRIIGVSQINHEAREQLRLVCEYRVKRRYTGRISYFATAAPRESNDSMPILNAWSRLATEGIDIHLIPGIHAGMLQEPAVQVSARELSYILHKVAYSHN